MSEYLTPEQEQAEEDAAISAAEDRHLEHLTFAREEALAFLRAEVYDLKADTLPTEPVELLLAWFDEVRNSHAHQADRITALLAAVDDLRPPF